MKKIEILFEDRDFGDQLLRLTDLSTLITKNRAINFMKSMKEDQRELAKLTEKYGDKIEEPRDVSVRNPETELDRGRKLYDKFVRNMGEHSLSMLSSKLSDKADVMNFKSEEHLCSNAQACQSQILKFIKFILTSFSRTKSYREMKLSETANISVFYQHLAEKIVGECSHYITKGLQFLHDFEQLDFEKDNLDAFIQAYDQVMFKAISGLFQFNKTIGLHFLPGIFVRGFLAKMVETKFISNLFDFAIKVTLCIEKALNLGRKIPIF